ncbi:hypothetical protein EU520_01595 [Candidatus Thorarchaeota archaeon]|nr:MAG: hypothetical protein EU520_01595 [Candidatus Thorarchaeota archaeon]
MKQERLTKPNKDTISDAELPEHVERDYPSTMDINIDSTDFKTHPLWKILVETTHRSPLYANLTGYVRESVLPVEPEIGPRELATRLAISVGEAMVILDDIRSE